MDDQANQAGAAGKVKHYHSIIIGNTAKPVGKRWGWVMFVNLHGVLADEVVSIKVHPTFQQRTHRLSLDHQSGIYQSIPFVGWGTFTVQVSVQLNRHKTFHYEHHLVFSEHGAQQTHSLDLGLHAEFVIPDLQRQQRHFLKYHDPAFCHGRIFDASSSLYQPKKTWSSSHKPRDDHDAPDWLTASEYQDVSSVLEIKIQLLAQLLRASRKTVVYSGAGISVSAGIGQAARGGTTTSRKTTTATPTFTHYALAALAQEGLIHGWVQQNHDGLPQKAGFPQERINEVHGSWYDPSNPVVVYSGTLRSQEHDWMIEDADTADLALVLGTSLGGLNSDQVAIKTAERSLIGDDAHGMVMINLQQTEHDGKCSLRIFEETDRAFAMLLHELHMPRPKLEPAVFSQGKRRMLVPYDENGVRSNSVRMMWLDLRPGAAIQLTPGHNIRGANQPMYMRLTKTKQPVGRVLRWRDSTVGIDLQIEDTGMTLGQWWMEAAVRGGPTTIPIVNIEPEFA